MSRTVKDGSRAAKSRPIPNRNQNCRIGNPISEVMQVVKGSLPKGGEAAQMSLLTGQPISSCQKMLCGIRPENLETLRPLLAGHDLDFAIDVLKAFVGPDAPIVKAVSQHQSIRQAKQLVKQLQAGIE